MDRFLDLCIDRSRTILLLLIFILIAGTLSYKAIPKERNPEVIIPIIFITMTHEGISPKDGVALLLKPMEQELRSIEGIKEMTSYARDGSASIVLEFDAGFDSASALADVREKVDSAKAELPEDTDEPIIEEVDLSLFPVLNVILTGNVTNRALLETARDLQDAIEAIPEVLKVDIAGDKEDTVEIIIDPLIIESYGLSASLVFEMVAQNNLLIAAGSIDTGKGRYTISVPGLIENLSEILALPVKVTNNATITVGDIATVRKTYRDPESYARVNGKEAVVLEVKKRTGTNIIDTIEKVKTVVAEETIDLPEAITLLYSQDTSKNIRSMLMDLQNNIVSALILVLVIIITFVGIRSSLLIAFSIPGAFLIGILILYFLGLTINIVVLFSLILSVGMLVDNAIVVCEMADRYMLDGKSKREAYHIAPKAVKWPVISATITTIVVFLPLLFWPGTVGQFMKYMPITLIATLSGSLLMALIFVPTLGTWFGKVEKQSPIRSHNARILNHGSLEDLQGFTLRYYQWLVKALHHRKFIVLGILALLIVVYLLFGMFSKGVEFFPTVEPEQAQLQIRARGNLSLNEKDKLIKEVEAKIDDLSEIRLYYARSGTFSGENLPQDTIGIIQMEFIDWSKRRKAAAILEEIRARTKDLGGVIIEPRTERAGPPQGKPIILAISSRNPDILIPAVDKIIAAIGQIPGLQDIEDTRPIPAIEWELGINRELAARLNINISTIGNFVKLVTSGLKASSYNPDTADEEVDILIRYPDKKRALSSLDNLRIIYEDKSIPISHFVTRKPVAKQGFIERINGKYTFRIRADVKEGIIADNKVLEIATLLEELALDPHISVTFKGDKEDQLETRRFLGQAFGIAIFVMMLILVMMFNRIHHMFIVMSAVFFATTGVLLGLLITGQPFGIVMCGVGIIALSGIVVNNNILLIDTYRHLVKEGHSFKEATLRAACQRFRPILLTAVTTALGLLPMVTAVNINYVDRSINIGAPSSQWWMQLSTTVAGGLTFATILTLFLTPSLIMLVHDVKPLKEWKLWKTLLAPSQQP